MLKKTLLSFLFITITLNSYSCKKNELKSNLTPKDSIKKHVPVTAFWFNGGWDHYDANTIKYLDEVIIFAVAPNPETGELYKFSKNDATGEVIYKRNSGAGLTTTMVKTLVNDAKKHNVKASLGINAMGRKEKIFNELVRNNKHEAFAKNILTFCLKHNITGIDVDYEHPGSDKDVEYLGKIYKALHKELKPKGITISGAFGMKREYTRKFLEKYHYLLDQVNIMCYLQTPASFIKGLNLLHTQHGIPKEKIFGGVGFYGKDRKNKASIDYRDIVKQVKITNQEESFTIKNPKDSTQSLNLSFNNSEKSLAKKVDFIRNNGFGGIMIWAINHDVPTTDANSRIKYLHSLTNGK